MHRNAAKLRPAKSIHRRLIPFSPPEREQQRWLIETSKNPSSLVSGRSPLTRSTTAHHGE
jgi:hypothetical protein